MTTSKQAIRWTLLAATCGMAGGLWSCDRETATSRAVQTNSRELTALSSGGSAPAPQEVRDKVYKQVETGVTGASAQAQGAEKSAAMLLVAAAQSGQAETPAGDIQDIELTFRSSMSRIEAAITRWSIASSIAAAAEAFDPSAQISRVTNAKKEKDTAVAAESARRETVEKRLGDLRARAKEKMTLAQAKFSEYSRLMDSTSQMTATAAEPVVEKASRIRMQGERLRIEGGKIEAEADSVQPQFDEVGAIVAQLTKQRQDLDAVEADLNRQVAQAKEEAAQARAAASAIGVEIRDGAATLDETRTTSLSAAYDRAETQLKATMKSATEAAKGSPSAGRAAAGSAHAALAELYWGRATSAQSYASLLESLSRVKPTLPGVEDYKARLTKVREERSAALASATSALDSAIQAYQSVSGPAAVKERVEALGKLLEDAKKLANNERLDASSPLAPPAWLQTSAGASSPEGAMAGIIAAYRNKKPAEMLDFVKLPSAEARQKLEPLVAMTAKFLRANDASMAKFNKPLGEVLTLGGGLGAMMGPMLAQQTKQGLTALAGDAAGISPEDFVWDIRETTATATAPGINRPMTFVKVGDQWKAEIPGIEMMLMQAEMAGGMAPLFDAFGTWAEEVEKGVYADETAAGQALVEQLTPLASGLMGGGG
ncbi:hypothetical protein PHYC_02309 [Phycisphaerales bacterium]|nr:hypothetical protein PHYC_02309 [Phycisphaerales bacterium]